MAAPITFEPEKVRMPTPKEKLQMGREQALESHRHLQRAIPGFDFARFKREFVPRLVAAYNKRAKVEGLVPLNPAWLDLVRRARGGAAGPKQFYVQHRARLQPRMFPGDPTKAKRAYDLFLKEMEKLPLVRSGPSSGMLSHESGHLQSFYEKDPETVIRSRRPRSGGEVGSKPPFETALNEAVASYRGFRTAWEAWKPFGIPRKAWGAWSGFPTYAANLSATQLKRLMTALKRMEAKYPGIRNQAHKALYEFADYVQPVLYNVPGKDWTDEEKAALQRFLKRRGGRYRETLPATPEERQHHMRRQPYVMRDQEAPSSRVASARLPLSIREAGEVVPFPVEKVAPPEEREKPADILQPSFQRGSFLLFVKGFPVGWYAREHDAVMAARHLANEFEAGHPSLLWQAVQLDAPEDDLVDWMTNTGRDIEEPVALFLTDPRYRKTRADVVRDMLFVLAVPGAEPPANLQTEGMPQGDLFDLEDKFRQAAMKHADELNWDRIAHSVDAANEAIRSITGSGKQES